MERPIATSGSLVEKTGITPATVNKALAHLERVGIVKELTARKRNRLFSYAGYIEIMSRWPKFLIYHGLPTGRASDFVLRKQRI